MPRRYSSEKRAAQADVTRRRIVDATLALHAERGILGTKPADIAARADVSLATYYKHFPSLGALVQACTSRGRDLIPPPDPRIVVALPADPAVRIPAMVETLFRYYEARDPWLYVGRTEERFVAELQPLMERLRGLRDAFIRAAMPEAVHDRDAMGLATVLVDYWTWRTLRRDARLTQQDGIRIVAAALQRKEA